MSISEQPFMLALHHSRRGSARRDERENVVGPLVSSRLVLPPLAIAPPLRVGFFVASQRTRVTRRGQASSRECRDVRASLRLARNATS